MLGAEQAGHIAGVGFDLYLRMIGEAVATFRGDEVESGQELRLELPLDARIPEYYIDSERLRLEAYQKLSAASAATAKDEAIDQVIEELVDRYGTPPEEVEGLLAISRLRRRAARAGLTDVVVMGSNLRIAPARLEDSIKVRLQRLYPKAKLVSGGEALVVPMPMVAADVGVGLEPLPDAQLLEWVGQLFTAIFPEPVKVE
jgi:transcription-repair coupling factor (superfamily II helicase)